MLTSVAALQIDVEEKCVSGDGVDGVGTAGVVDSVAPLEDESAAVGEAGVTFVGSWRVRYEVFSTK